MEEDLRRILEAGLAAADPKEAVLRSVRLEGDAVIRGDRGRLPIPVLAMGADSSGGVLRKMVSPENPRRRHQRPGASLARGRALPASFQVVCRAHRRYGHPGRAAGLRAEVHGPLGRNSPTPPLSSRSKLGRSTIG